MDIRGFIQKYNHETTALGILLAGILLTIAVYTILPPLWAPNNTFFSGGLRLTQDTFDITIYQHRAQWLPLQKIPYTEHPIEYPLLTLPLFSLPALVSHDHYALVFSLIMVALLIATIYALFRITSTKKYALLLLLPSALYFSLYRFDIVPALLALLSVWYFTKNNYIPAWALLGLSVGVKVFAWPLVILYLLLGRKQTNPPEIKKQFRTGLLIFLTITILPLALFGAIYSWEVLKPFLWQATRSSNTDSLWGVLTTLHPPGALLEGIIKTLSMCVPLGAAIWLGSKTKATPKNIFRISALCIMLVVLFSNFYSPQWLLWWTPLILATTPNKKIVALLVTHDLINYLQFPVLYDINPFSASYTTAVTLRSVIMVILMIYILYELKSEHQISSLEKNPKNKTLNSKY